ncbi:DUF1661 domain-containing protein [Porphyromonas gingivalis]|nr:DUF1661 domain-containing protein [Porphyromonas gingivalis]
MARKFFTSRTKTQKIARHIFMAVKPAIFGA